MENNKKQKEIKYLAIFLTIIFIFNIAVYIFLFFKQRIQSTPLLLANLVPLILIPFVIFGLLTNKKFGINLGVILSAILITFGLLSVNIIQIIIWGIVLYYLIRVKKGEGKEPSLFGTFNKILNPLAIIGCIVVILMGVGGFVIKKIPLNGLVLIIVMFGIPLIWLIKSKIF